MKSGGPWLRWEDNVARRDCTTTQHWGAFMQPLLQCESNKYYIFGVCVCSLMYPACNALAPCCHLWPVRLYNIFPHYLINGTIFGKKLLNTNCVFWYSVQLLSDTFLILRRIQQDMIEMCVGLRVLCRLLLSALNGTWSSSTNFRNVLKFHETPSSGSRVVPWERTDRQAARRYEVHCRFRTFAHVKMDVEGMCGLDSTDSGNALSNKVPNCRDCSQTNRGSILSKNYEFVCSPASEQALELNSASPASEQALEPTPDCDKIQTGSGAQFSFLLNGWK